MAHFLVFQLTFGLPEIIVFQLGAVVLGFCIHLFLVSRKSSLSQLAGQQQPDPHQEDWKMKYFADMDQQELVRNQIKEELRKAQEKEAQAKRDLVITRDELMQLKISLEGKSTADMSEYVAQLEDAQEKLLASNDQLHSSLQHLQNINDAEKKFQTLRASHESLNVAFTDLQKMLSAREVELKQLQQHKRLSEEMTGRLEKAYEDYYQLQQKLTSLETHLSQSRQNVQGYDELQESYFKLTKEFDELKLKQIDLMEENQRMARMLSDAEEKLRESNFQRQQLSKKVVFLEQLNKDLQQISEQQKKLQGQFRRLTDIEQMISRATGRDQETSF
jgi:chromosome segregation ATPase